MVMPVMTKMYKLTGDTKYLDKLYDNLLTTDESYARQRRPTSTSVMASTFIQSTRVPTERKTSGLVVMAGFSQGQAKVLQDMPKTTSTISSL